ncbi:MAG TPA: GNAT family N-acetyltransferase [Solirubrobacterales bacterium]|nr:GNAT family N-acetyltransferase [Solirubrobacterales bacterium]
MSDPSPTVPGAPPRSGPSPNAHVRAASGEDAPAVAAAIEALLIELGGERPSTGKLEGAARELTDGRAAGALLVAEAGEAMVGVLAASWQHAIHVPGRYGTIQDLWVDPEWRGRAVGRELVEALVRLAGELGIARLEVGLPQESFAQIDATERFYLDNGFSHLGPRMRR